MPESRGPAPQTRRKTESDRITRSGPDWTSGRAVSHPTKASVYGDVVSAETGPRHRLDEACQSVAAKLGCAVEHICIAAYQESAYSEQVLRVRSSTTYTRSLKGPHLAHRDHLAGSHPSRECEFMNVSSRLKMRENAWRFFAAPPFQEYSNVVCVCA